jgi:deazaflavin-dependent oxidoreductase (nitroreductase family)
MMRIHRRGGDRFQGMDLLYITTVGARSGRQRTNPVARFEDGQGGWHVVASANGAAQHPAWYHNVADLPRRARRHHYPRGAASGVGRRLLRPDPATLI